MKTLIQFFTCVSLKIKKNFFNFEINDIYHGCEEVLGSNAKSDTEKEQKEVEEYLNNYTTTTRWQTI